MINKKIKLAMVLLIGVLLVVSISAYSRSTTQYIPPASSSKYLGSSYGLSSFSRDKCQAGQDFVVQISPLGCTPTVVRSDLLEEQNVPVFCQLAATKINPLIEVEAIESVSFSGEYPREVSGVGFHPANAGIKTSRSTLLNSPVLNNIGYAVVVLKEQPNESAMPEWVEGNLTARIKYDVKDAFGIGRGTYYLPILSDEEWDLKYNQYGFWQGKGFLRADYIDEDNARVSIYQDKEDKITSISLEKGKTSGKINIPGFYCLASLQLKLDSLVVPDTRAKFEVDGEIVEVIKGEKFLDNKCSVKSLEKKGLNQEARVYCRTDEGGEDFTFEINPKIGLDIDGEIKDYVVGEKIFEDTYIGYIASKKESGGKIIDTDDNEDLIIYFYDSPNDVGEKLSDSKLTEIKKKVESDLRKVENLNEPFLGDYKSMRYNEEKIILNRNMKFIGFSQVQNTEFSTDKTSEDLDELREYEEDKVSDLEEDILFKENYENAIKTYDEILNSYSSIKYEELEDISYGEIALYEKIKLANAAGQKKSAYDFCENFKERYPDSNYFVEDICSDFSLANSESSTWDILINGEVRSISFKEIYEPSLEEYSAEVSVEGEDYILTKNEIVNFEKGSIQLTNLDDEVATIKMIVKSSTYNGTKTLKLKEDILESVGDVSIILEKINLEKQAKVTVIPSIDNTGTEADFTFKIGIEKRAIQLSPEKTKEKIENLNKTIEKWEKINSNLGNVVKGMKGACLTTAGFLTVKNFFTGFSGKAASRHEVTEMYRDKCKEEKTEDMQECLLKYNDEINKDVETLAGINTYREKVGDEINYDEDGNLENKDKYLDGISGNSKELLEDENYKTELRDILYYEEMKKKGGIFEEEAEKKLGEIWQGLDEEYARSNLAQSAIKDWSDSGLKGMSVQTAVFKNQRPIYYTDAITPFDGWRNIEGSKPVQGIIHKNVAYVLELDSVGEDNYRIVNVYSESGEKIEESNLVNEIRGSYSVKKFDSKSYENKYEDPKVIYYEIGENKGRPSIVPIDVDKGFYAATNPTSLDSVSAYEESGMPSYFYLCNVMGNSKQEFNLGGDDECVGVRVGSNKADGALPGLSEGETTRWARKGISALREASRQYGEGVSKVSILGEKINVGNPAVNLPGTQCEDFMSPADCSLLFNVCDPVVCPESRCDFGGKYRVSNVVQSGIIGSTLLCLPNFGSPSEGGVIVPVCLTGIHAGIDSLLSIYKNYGDCLQENLDTGKTVGVCDEIHSIYLCEFFWKQAIPLSKLALGGLTDFLFGSKGGGEYLQVGEAFSNSAKSVNYMTNYYGANSFAAFKARSTDEVGSAVCKNFISARYPASGDFFSALIEPDSPSQYHAWFHETSFSTATSPPTSQYKVFYHIYAGRDSGVFYQVYLKSPEGGSFYSTAQRINVDSGYIEAGGYASETRDMLEVSGYKELCINIQGQEECGFKEVSTSFALDYLQDEYVKDQAERTDIKTEKECISGSASLYSAITPNIQAGAESVINPEIYNQGIIRVCATDNPGKSTDNSRWVKVGICSEGISCWLDKDSVSEAVNFNESLEGLEEVTEDALENLRREGDYLNVAKFEELIEKIEKAENKEKIELVNDNFKKVFFNYEKAELLWLKAKAYAGLVVDFLEGKKGEVVEEEEKKAEDFFNQEDCERADYIWKEDEDVCFEGVEVSENVEGERETIEKIDCSVLTNWESEELIEGFKLDNELKIFRTKLNVGKCDGKDIEKINEETETNYYLKKEGDIYIIYKPLLIFLKNAVGRIDENGNIYVDEGEEIKDLENYVFDFENKIFELR